MGTSLIVGLGCGSGGYAAAPVAPVPSPQAEGLGSDAGAGSIAHRVARSTDDVDATPPKPGQYRLHLIDVGTGLSVLVQGADFNLLFDGGSADDKRGISATENNSRLLAYLWEAIGPSGPVGCQPGALAADAARAQLPLQTVILSHPHEDHGVFLDEVLRCYAVSDVYDSGAVNDAVFYEQFIQAVAAEPGVTYHTAVAPTASGSVTVRATDHRLGGDWQQFSESTGRGDRLELGWGAFMSILHADGEWHSDFNENSLVVRLDLGDTSVLLTGDAESGPRRSPSAALGDIEAHLVAEHREAIDVDILQVGHHGSETSSRWELLQAVSPDWALIGAGPRSYSGVELPDDSVVQALVQVTGDEGRVLRTDTSDALGCEVDDRIGSDEGRPGGCDSHVLEVGF